MESKLSLIGMAFKLSDLREPPPSPHPDLTTEQREGRSPARSSFAYLDSEISAPMCHSLLLLLVSFA